MLKECAPGIWEWDTKDMAAFRAFAVVRNGRLVLVDPVKLDAAEEQQIQALGTVEAIVITGPYHERAAAQLGKRYAVPIYAHPDALAKFESKDVQPFPPELPLGLEVLSGEGAFAGQVVLYAPWDAGSLITGDFIQNVDFKSVPLPVRLLLKYVIKLRDGLHLLPPVKAQHPDRMLESARKLLERPIERVLVSHGNHVHSRGHARLAERLELGV